MSDEGKVKTEEELKVEAEKKEADMALKLQNLESKVEGTEMLAKILADPDVRALLEAKQKGEKVKVVSAKEKVQAKMTGLDNEIDFDALSNKQLADHVLKHVTSNLDTVFAAKLDPINQVIKSLETYVGTTEAKTVAQQIEEVKKKYKDFDTFLPDMQKMNKVNPDLSVEELYLISKRRKTGPSKVETERPSTSPAAVPEKKKRDVPLPKGNAGFGQLMSEALAKLELPG